MIHPRIRQVHTLVDTGRQLSTTTRAIGRESLSAPSPAGFIAHLAGPKPNGGWRVIDLWESENAANSFYGSEQFRPVMAGASNMGISTTPWPMHRVEVDQTVKHAG